MAKTTLVRIIGVDVAKHELVIHDRSTGLTVSLENSTQPIRNWLNGLDGPCRIAVEPTSSYHVELLEHAAAAGHTLYLVNPRQLVHYREVVNLRHKSDPEDAWLLARFLDREGKDLRPYRPTDRQARALWALIKRRASIVKARKQLRQSLNGSNLSCKALMTQIRVLISRIDRRIRTLVEALGWQQDYQRCRSVPGIGPLNAAAMLCAFNRGAFASADAFVAFLGLDIRRRDSGLHKGKRKLTKRGDPELRRLLYCAAKPARSHPNFDRYYQSQIDKGLSKIAANVILARKLARITFALLSNQQNFDRSSGLRP